MKKIIYLFLIAALCGSAQNPGYMGKHVSLSYGFYISPGYVGSGGLKAFNILHEGALEFTTGRKFVLGFSGRFYKTECSNSRDVNYQVPITGGYGGGSTTGRPDGYFDIAGQNFMIYGKVFRGAYVAPWGRYFTFGVTLNRFTATYDPSVMRITYNSYDGTSYTNKHFTDFGDKEQTYMRPDLMIGFGRSRIIANRVVLEYGWNMNLFAAATIIFDVSGDTLFGENQLDSSNYIEALGKARVRGVNRFNAFIKIGVLLF